MTDQINIMKLDTDSKIDRKSNPRRCKRNQILSSSKKNSRKSRLF